MQKLPVPSPVWQQYVEQGTLQKNALSPIIADSWERSRNEKINPLRVDANDLLNNHSLKERIENCHHLINAAEPIMVELYQVLKGGGYAILLTDHQGYILKSLGDPGFEEKVRKIWLAVGANWQESVKGTNAIGTAIANRSALKVFAWEHFCQENHILNCSAAPIFSPQGELIGVLDISSDYHHNDPHILGSAIAAAKAIENRLLLENTQNELVFACQQLSSVMDAVPEGLLTINKDGCITKINQTGSILLGLPPQDCIGQSFDNFFRQADNWFGELKHSKGILERTATIETPGGNSNTLSIKMLSGNSKNFYGAVASIHKLGPKGRTSTPALAGSTRYFLEDIIGTSPQMLEAKHMAAIAARSDSNVLLQGSSGTGKEMFAQSIHNASSRASGPFVAINCGAVPANLMESELFGYEEGAFTGAKKGGQAGKFELAQGGTIFLDEIGEMPLPNQVALLRVLEEKSVVRIGGYNPIPLNVRVIAATNKNLESEIANGKFRLDLYYRLNIMTIDIPPLRERADDIIVLAQHLLKRLSQKSGKNITKISPDLQKWLLAYSWPGNVRELENIIERAVNLCEDDTITRDHLPSSLRKSVYVSYVSPLSLGTPDLTLESNEKQAIKDALFKTNRNITKTAKILGIGRTTLHRKIKEFQL